MARLKSLLYREWKLSRKYYSTGLVMLVLFMALFWLLRLSISVGNLSVMQENDDWDFYNKFIYYFAVYIVEFVAVITFTGGDGVIKSDLTSGWLRYSFGLPITPLNRAMVQYILLAGGAATALLIGVLNALVMSAMSGIPLTGGTVLNFFIIVDIMLFSDTVRRAFASRARDMSGYKKCDFASLAVLFAVCLVLVRIAVVMVSELASTDSEEFDPTALLESFSGYRDIAAPWLIPIAVVLLAIGFVLTLKGYERREK